MFFYMQLWKGRRAALCLPVIVVFSQLLTVFIGPEALASSVTFDLEAFSSGLVPGVDISRFNRHDSLAP